MKIVPMEAEFIDCTPNIAEIIEYATRTCYKSHDKIGEGSAEKLFKQVVKQHHHDSVAEHGNITMQITCDRATHTQFIRHRHFSFSAESQRYCNYMKDKFLNEVVFIKPEGIDEGTEAYNLWEAVMKNTEWYYKQLIKEGIKPESARSVLPNSAKCEFTVTGNVRQWRSFFKLRTSSHAQKDIRVLSHMIHGKMIDSGKVPAYFFDDIIGGKE